MQNNQSISRNRKLDERGERQRLLEQYMGIFPYAIKEFGEMVARRPNKPKKNYSK